MSLPAAATVTAFVLPSTFTILYVRSFSRLAAGNVIVTGPPVASTGTRPASIRPSAIDAVWAVPYHGPRDWTASHVAPRDAFRSVVFGFG